MTEVDRDTVCEAFIDAVPFDLYPFQEEAVLGWFECEDGMLVSAPTGMGKTLVAEAAVFEALKTGRRLYYTTPLIALTDQKLAELQDRAESWGYPRDSVGLLTGNRKLNPDAPILVVVAEILLNHLLEETDRLADVSAVVMDEFHWLDDPERGVVWELSLVFLPAHVRVMLLSATVGNAVDFVVWMRDELHRTLRLVQTTERRVPLTFAWVEDRLLTDQLVEMASGDDATRRTPALVFCFSRDECWELGERLKGLPLVDKARKAEVEAVLAERGEALDKGAGPKLRTMLVRGVGVHHAGVLPRHKDLVEDLFLRKLVPYVVCTETLAAGVNLPARSVVLRTLLKGKPGERKLLPASAAHQMFGRAGRPQFDDRGFVFALAHDDDVKIRKWHARYDELAGSGSKDPGILKALKQLERKRPSRRKTEQYWTEAQFKKLIEAPPANLRSRSMIPYHVLLYLLAHGESLADVRSFLARRFQSAARLERYVKDLDGMVANLQALGHLEREEDGDAVTLDASIEQLSVFRSVDPLFGDWLARTLLRASADEKMLALEGVLPLPWQVAKRCGLPDDMPKGPLQEQVLEPIMIGMGITLTVPEPTQEERDYARFDVWGREEDETEKPPTFAEMLKIAFEAELPAPHDLPVQSKWCLGGIRDGGGEFHRFVASRDLAKGEGLVLRHVLRLAILAGEFLERTEDPHYEDIGRLATQVAESVDPKYTETFLSSAERAAAVTISGG